MRYRLMTSTSAVALSPDEPAAAPPADTPATDTPAAEPPKAEDKPLDLGKPEDTALTQEPKAEDKPADDKPAVPEAYELKAPDGSGELDPAAVAQATPVFKDLGLSNEQAQKIVDLYAGQVLPEVSKTVQLETLKLLGLEGIGSWAEQLKTDPEIGGAQLEKTKAMAAQAMSAFATDGLKQLLHTSRLGNHPEMVRLFAKIGEAIGEGTIHNGNPSGATPATGPEAFYDPAFGPKG